MPHLLKYKKFIRKKTIYVERKMKKNVKIIIFVVGFILTLVVLGLICYSFNNYLKGYYSQLANDYTNNQQYYLEGGVTQQTINERIQTYTQLSTQSLNGEEPEIFIFGILVYIVLYCIAIANGEKFSKILLKIAGVLSMIGAAFCLFLLISCIANAKMIATISNVVGADLTKLGVGTQIVLAILMVLYVLFGLSYFFSGIKPKVITFALSAAIAGFCLAAFNVISVILGFYGRGFLGFSMLAIVCFIWSFFVLISVLSNKPVEA